MATSAYLTHSHACTGIGGRLEVVHLTGSLSVSIPALPDCPTEHISQNPSIDVSEVQKACPFPECEALEL